MILKDIIADTPDFLEIRGDERCDIRTLCTDSRRLSEGALFFCIPGLRYDAHDFAADAVRQGARALVVDHLLDIDVPQVLVKNVRRALSYMAAAYYGHPARKLRLIGLTGTKGKTTTSILIKSILEHTGAKVGLIGTICSMIGDTEIPSNLTTPDPIDFQRLLLRMVDEGVQYVVMEVSAHALDMDRVAGIRFAAAGFTNFSQDHLDYFHTMDAYMQAKMRLFTDEMCRTAVYNCDDESVAKEFANTAYVPCGICEQADVFGKDIEPCARGYHFQIVFHKRYAIHVSMRLNGLFNVYNALMAAAICDCLGADGERIREGLEAVNVVPGRIELLDTDTPYRVILDYAHSPGSLESVLRAIRQTARARVIALFGCGGDRDHEKRPLMGEIGGRLADMCILTSDNPRGEDPYRILEAVEDGIRRTECEYTVIENRRQAIRYGLTICGPGDVLVLAGKGHETYQEIKGVKYPFNEKLVVNELLAQMRQVPV